MARRGEGEEWAEPDDGYWYRRKKSVRRLERHGLDALPESDAVNQSIREMDLFRKAREEERAELEAELADLAERAERFGFTLHARLEDDMDA